MKLSTLNFQLSISSKGQSLFELIFAIAIATIILTGIVSLASVSVRNSTSSRDNALANRYAQEAIEWLRLQRDAVDWTTFSGYAGATNKDWCLKVSPPAGGFDEASGGAKEGACSTGDEINSNTIYLRDINLALIDVDGTLGDGVEAVVTVSWADSQGTHSVTQATKFTDWQ